jgi:hypothetical protein
MYMCIIEEPLLLNLFILVMYIDMCHFVCNNNYNNTNTNTTNITTINNNNDDDND